MCEGCKVPLMIVSKEEISPYEMDESTILPASPVNKHITGVQFCPTNNGFSGPVSFQLLSSWVMCEQITGS